VAEDDDLAVEHRPPTRERVQRLDEFGKVGAEIDRPPAAEVDPAIVDDRQAPPAIPLRLERPAGAVGQPVDQGREHRAVGG
jgi:hypothetical protein